MAEKKETEEQKAVKALEAAFRKAERAGIKAKAVYVYTDENGGSHLERLLAK